MSDKDNIGFWLDHAGEALEKVEDKEAARAIRLLLWATRAEREATPPAPAVDDASEVELPPLYASAGTIGIEVDHNEYDEVEVWDQSAVVEYGRDCYDLGRSHATPPAPAVDDEPGVASAETQADDRAAAYFHSGWKAAEQAVRDGDIPGLTVTPPAPAVDDEPGAWVCGACALGSETHGHAASTCVYQPVWRPALVSTPTPTPAPDQPEAAVEALARLLYSGAWYWGRVPVGTQDAVREDARHLLAALDRGAIPGYGPTGDRAGEGA